MIGSMGDTIATQLLIFIIFMVMVGFSVLLYQKLSVANKHCYYVKDKDRKWHKYLADPPDNAGLALVGKGVGAKGLRVNEKTSDRFNAGILFPEWVEGSLHIDPKSLQLDFDRLKSEVETENKDGKVRIVSYPILEAVDTDEIAETDHDQINQDTLISLKKHTTMEYMQKNMEENLRKKKEIFSLTNILIILSLAMNGFMIYSILKIGKNFDAIQSVLLTIADRIK